jgi:hypothetical protein
MMLLSDLALAVSNGSLTIDTDLCKIMKIMGSDKCSSWHNYTPIYSELFEKIRYEEIRLLEVGVFHGSSARAWREYFPNAEIHLADVEESYLIHEPGYSSHVCDQDSAISIANMWKNIGNQIYFDIIIDDGKHEFHSNLNFLLGSIQNLKKNGIFIVEDLTADTWNMFSAHIDKIKSEQSLSEACMIDIPSDSNKIDNRILIIRK